MDLTKSTISAIMISSDILSNGDPATLTNLSRSYDFLRTIIARGQTLVLYYGDDSPLATEVSGMASFAAHLRKSDKVRVVTVASIDEIKVAAILSSVSVGIKRKYNELYKTIKSTNEAAFYLNSGWSVIYHLNNVTDYYTLCKQMRRLYRGKTKKGVNLEDLDVIVAIDKRGGKALGRLIQAPGQQKYYMDILNDGNGDIGNSNGLGATGDDNSRGHRNTGSEARGDGNLRSLDAQYYPQITPIKIVEKSALIPEWVSGMAFHTFRNMTMPITAKRVPMFPLDLIGGLISFIPSRRRYLISILSENARGEEVKSLLESWYNVHTGTPDTFLRIV